MAQYLYVVGIVLLVSMATSGTSGPPLTTHILDTALGVPAANVSMVLSKQGPNGDWQVIEKQNTSSNGRGGFLANDNRWEEGVFKLYFDTASYFDSKGFYPYVEVVFRIEDPAQHYHVPLLLSPYGYSTYRGS